ncbi:MAG: AraC family transcriptional regulator [Paludibacter sp.]|nr:AraC family transcriptional regulator [Paludibacter sp.]MDD4429291.1 AraC family transcriptional regulator [Paludibacter sp.]
MSEKELSRQIYVARINRVMDYVEKNMDQPVDLSVMAEVAAFSPYHFHRIFTCVLGETPSNFVTRVKLEKSAQLLQDSNLLISDIAYKCGFRNLSSYSRAFKSYFGVSAKFFRNQEKAVYIKNGIRYSKNCKAASKIGKTRQLVNAQFCDVELNQLLIMNAQIEIKQMPKLHLIYCRHMGAFNKIGGAYEKLFRWAAPRGLVSGVTKTVTVYHDDPSVTSIDKVRQDASILLDPLVYAEVKAEGEFCKSTVEGGKFAVGHFTIKETEFEQAWNSMCSWLTESGYQPDDGCTYEYYHNDYNEHPEHKFIVDICIPVKPL